MHDLDALISLICRHFTFTAAVYPELHGMSEERRLAFALRHSALHFAKTAGKISAVSERVDHGEDIDMNELRQNVHKALINTLRLADLVGLSGKDLIAAVEEKYQDTIQKI